ncbi:Nitroreductase-like protein [Nemania abortiva]|nr:Nitroreductase-like protein [Nemania abortiva]
MPGITLPPATASQTAQALASKQTDPAISTEEAQSPVPNSDDEPQPSPSTGITTPPSQPTSPPQMLLDDAILTRHSTRQFLPTPVPQALISRALSLASHSPSDTNTQAWRLFIVSGEALARLKSSLLSAAATREPDIAPFPPAFQSYRSALGKAVFGDGFGVAHDDAEGRKAATMRNYAFYGAPVAVIVCMSAALEGRAAFSVGMYVQTLLLALTEVGVGSCVEVSVAGFADVVKREVGIGEDLRVLVGVAVGFEDEGARVNAIRSEREEVGRTTVWVE